MDVRTQGGKGRVGRLGDQDISDFPSLHPTRPHSHLVDDLLSLQPFFRCLQPQGSFLSDIQSSSQLSDTKYHCAIVWSNQAITIERLIQDSPEVHLLTMTTQGTLLLSWVRRTLRERRKDSPPLRKVLLQGCGLNLGAESLLFSFRLSSEQNIQLRSDCSPWAYCDPMDCSPPGSCVHGIVQARIRD